MRPQRKTDGRTDSGRKADIKRYEYKVRCNNQQIMKSGQTFMCPSLKCGQSYLFDILIEENQLLGSVCSKEFMDQTELEESDINDSKVQL